MVMVLDLLHHLYLLHHLGMVLDLLHRLHGHGGGDGTGTGRRSHKNLGHTLLHAGRHNPPKGKQHLQS
jgi:hypothetical protein